MQNAFGGVVVRRVGGAVVVAQEKHFNGHIERVHPGRDDK